VQDGSDVCIVTSDNPRTEDPAQIMSDTVKGFTRRCYVEIPDRADAIKSAVNNARPGDIVLIAGKGHENYQEINGVKHPFDDARVAHGLLRALRSAKAERLANRIQAEQLAQEELELRRIQQGRNTGPSRRKWNE
jgi:UDP-N-acetylmuramoyl-L-alanyl-D-glutamate--2,6-diaminopimelate ligase